MASSIVHLAIVGEIAKRLDFGDIDRLKFGAVLPDAGENRALHLKIRIADGRKTTYDFDRFRRLFGERMPTDGLYLGYYLHLAQDALYRQFVNDRTYAPVRYLAEYFGYKVSWDAATRTVIIK